MWVATGSIFTSLRGKECQFCLKAARDCHRQFATAQPNRQGITAYGCGHFIFRDNPPLAISAIVKAYTGVVSKEQGDAIRERFVSYSPDAINEARKGH